MAKLPNPPAVAALRLIPPQLRTLHRGTKLWRLFLAAGAHPTTWNAFRSHGPTRSRFDHHLPPPRLQARKILYAARDVTTCFAEFFQATRTIDRRSDRPRLVEFELKRDIQLLDLTGTWPTQAGASMAINSGPRPRAQRWSKAIYAAYPGIDGLLYASSMHANRDAVALYERGELAVAGRPLLHRFLKDRAMDLVVNIAASQLKYSVVP